MILHIVFFDFKENITWADTRAIEAEKVSKGHPTYIPQIKKWTAVRNIISRDQSSDFCVMGLFSDHDDLSAYQQHPDHQRGVNSWKEISDWKVMDFEVKNDDVFIYDRMVVDMIAEKEEQAC